MLVEVMAGALASARPMAPHREGVPMACEACGRLVPAVDEPLLRSSSGSDDENDVLFTWLEHRLLPAPHPCREVCA